MSEPRPDPHDWSLVHCSALDAYRADQRALSSLCSEQEAFEWLRFATILERATSLDRLRRYDYVEAALAAPRDADAARSNMKIDIASASSVSRELSLPLLEEILARAAQVEDANGFALAMTILDFGRAILPIDDTVGQGRITIQQARILRKLGELDGAESLLDRVLRAGATKCHPHLEARARVGKAVIAQGRGNYPSARSEFKLALRLTDDSVEGREVAQLAHHGLLVASAVAGDFEAALRHGGNALALAVTAEDRAEVEVNLASVCYDIGEFRPALNGYLLALATAGRARFRLAAIGGAALAAARLGDAAIVEALAIPADDLLKLRGNEHAAADMSRELFEAFAILGRRARAERFRQAALERASKAGFHEIVYRVEAFVAPQSVSAPRIAIAGDAWEVTERLAAPNSEELLLTAIRTGHSEAYTHYKAGWRSQTQREE